MCLVLGFAVCGCTQPKPVSGANADSTPAKATLTVYYFHRTARCPSCEKIEALTQKAVQDGFAAQLAAGAMQWRVVNIDEPQNAHFETDYRLEAQSVVLSEMRDGKETRWKNLDKVWDLLSDDAAFVRYVQDEIRAYAQGG